MSLNYHIGRLVLSSLCVGDLVRLVLSGVRFAGGSTILLYSPFSLQVILRQVHSLFQSEFSTQRDLVLPLSISGTLNFCYGHPVAAYVFFLVFPSLLFCIIFYIVNSVYFIYLCLIPHPIVFVTYL